MPSLAKLAGTAFFSCRAFWCAYQYLLLVYSGATPGLKLAKLELQRFDGDPVPRVNAALARAGVRAFRDIAGPGICLVSARRGRTLLARSNHKNVHGAEKISF